MREKNLQSFGDADLEVGGVDLPVLLLLLLLLLGVCFCREHQLVGGRTQRGWRREVNVN